MVLKGGFWVVFAVEFIDKIVLYASSPIRIMVEFSSNFIQDSSDCEFLCRIVFKYEYIMMLGVDFSHLVKINYIHIEIKAPHPRGENGRIWSNMVEFRKLNLKQK